MDDLIGKFKVQGRDGKPVSIELHARDYEEAHKAGLTLTQHLNRKFGRQVDLSKGSVVGQMMADAGMFLANDSETGMRAPTMRQVVTDGINISAITRNDGSERHTPNGRLLFPEIIMRTMEQNLQRSDDLFLSVWNQMVAVTTSINGPTFDQPVINTTHPEMSESNQISQLAEPDVMISITTANKPRKIPTNSIGLVISDEAMDATTLDLVNLSMKAQARGQTIRMVEGHMKSIFNGDVDLDEDPLDSVKMKDFDSSITKAGEVTHEAWFKYLWNRYQYRTLNYAVADLDTAFAIENRKGKPVAATAHHPEGHHFTADMDSSMIAVKSPKILPVETNIVGANTLIGMDSQYAIRRVVNVRAQYSAMEQWLLRKGRAFRIDYGEICHKLYPEAFSKVTLTL